MRTGLIGVFTGSAVMLAGISGCHCCHRGAAPAPPPRACPVGPPTGVFVPGPPPDGRPIGVPSPQIPPAPVPVGPDVRNYEPPSRIHQGSYYWTPSPGSGVRLDAPVPSAPEADERPAPKAPATPEPPRVNDERQAAASFPVGIAQFAVARERVASGLKPSIDGLSWLQEAGYKTVLHIRKAGEDDAGDRKQIAKHGLAYLSLEASPTTLSQAVLDDFAKIVGDAKTQPLFVYDGDGVVAGGLWYLYFRTVGKDSDETARIKAGQLGLKEDADGQGKVMWAAVQKLMSERGS